MSISRLYRPLLLKIDDLEELLQAGDRESNVLSRLGDR